MESYDESIFIKRKDVVVDTLPLQNSFRILEIA